MTLRRALRSAVSDTAITFSSSHAGIVRLGRGMIFAAIAVFVEWASPKRTSFRSFPTSLHPHLCHHFGGPNAPEKLSPPTGTRSPELTLRATITHAGLKITGSDAARACQHELVST